MIVIIEDGVIKRITTTGNVPYANLTLTNSIVNADIAAGAAIAGTKLSSGWQKDVASGIVAQDVSGFATVTGSRIYLTQDGSNNINIYERTNSDNALQITRKAASLFQVGTFHGGVVQQIAVLDTAGDIPHLRPKAASANLRHSNDAAANDNHATYTKLKTFTFQNGISGTLRVYFEMKVFAGLETGFAKVYKNGVAIGTEQTNATNVYVAKTEDINFGVLAPGDTIELWGHVQTFQGDSVYVQNFRLSYDNAADTVLVAGVTAS